MSNITASKVKELRNICGAGMMDCKKALIECEGDVDQAMGWLRKKGLATANKKACRIAADGLIGIKTTEHAGCLVEVNSETDFVARNESFQTFVSTVTEIGLQQKIQDIDNLGNTKYPHKEHTITTELTNLISVIGENMNIRRAMFIEVNNGIVASYLHNKIANSLGQIGILVAIESDGDKLQLMDLGKKIAMHIAAANPKSCTINDLDPDLVKQEREIIRAQVKASGKPPEFAEKIVEGKIRKFYEESILTEQVFLIDDTKRKVSQVLKDAETEIESKVHLKGFLQFRLGEGIEKKQEDFATEVTAQLK